MKRLASGLFAAGLAFATAITGVAPASAAPARAAPTVPALAEGAVPLLQVQLSERELRRLRRAERRIDRRIDRRVDRRNFQRRGDRYYYNGYRGYRDRRPGYRSHNGFWFPAAAFLAGALATGAVRGGSRMSDAHINWCANRYRSYRASDNTFQPNSGPRRACVSPR